MPPGARRRWLPRLALCVCALAAGALLACGASPLERGRSALEGGRYPEAVDAAREGLSADPDDGHLRLLLAEAYFGQERWRDAREAAEGALVSQALDDTERGRGHQLAAEALARLDEPLEGALHAVQAHALGAWANDVALRALLQSGVDQALARHRPGDALALLRELRGLSREAGAGGPDDALILATGRGAVQQLLDMNAFADALALLGELVDEFPEADDLWLLRGGVELRMGELEAARADFDHYTGGLADASGRAARLVEVAGVMTEVQAWSLAMEAYNEALAADADVAGARLGLLDAQLATARLAEARTTLAALLEHAARSGPDALAAAYVAAAERLRERQQGDWALEVLQEGHSRVHAFEVTADLAEALERRERPAQAEAAMRDFVDRAEARGAAAEAVGDWYFERGAPQRAALFYREATAAPDASPDIYLDLARAYAALDYGYELVAAVDAWIDARGGEEAARRTGYELLAAGQLWAEAARVLEPVAEAHPDDRRLRLELGRTYWLAGEPDRETALYEAWVEGSDNPGQIALTVARTYTERGDYRQSLTWLERAREHDESRAQALLELGAAHQMLAESDEMWTAYDAYLAESDGALAAYEGVLARFEPRRFSAEAVQLLRRMIESAPWRADLRLMLAERLLQTGDPAAEGAFVDYVLAADDPVDAARRAVWALRYETDTGMAGRVLDAAAAARPDVAELSLVRARYLLNAAQARRAEGDLEHARAYTAAARAAFRDFLASAPTDWATLLRAAGEMDSAGLDDLAVAAYERAEARGADVTLFRRPYALALVSSGQSPDRARALLAAEVAESPDGVALAVQAAGELARNGEAEAAFDLLRRAQVRSADDAERGSVFRTGAELLAADGAVDNLIALSNGFVETSSDQTAALQEAAAALAEAGLWGPARERIDLALRRTSAGPELATLLAEVTYGAGGAEAALAAVAEHVGGDAATWRNVARFFEGRHELEAAYRAWMEVVGSDSQDVEALAEVGAARARLGDLDGAREAFDGALDPAVAGRATPSARRYALERATSVLADVGAQELADDYFERALVDSAMRIAFLLPAAERALARGRDDRGQEMLEAHLEEGGPLADVVAVELDHGFRAQPVARVRAEVLEGEPLAAAGLLRTFWDAALAYHGAETLAIWVDQLRARGADTEELEERLAEALVRAGRPDEAALRLAETAEERPADALWAAALEAAADRPDQAITLLGRSLGPASATGSSPSSAAVAQTLGVLTVVSGPDLAERAGATLVQRSASPVATLARLDWLLARHRIGDAAALFEGARPLLGDAAAGVAAEAGGGDPLEEGVALFGARDYAGEADSFAEAVLGDPISPDERFRAAIRHAFAAGDTERGEALVERYLDEAAGYGAAVLALGSELVEAGRDEGVDLLLEALGSGSDADARVALRRLLELALAQGRAELADDAVETALARPGTRYHNTQLAAEVAEEAGASERAADLYRDALALFPERPGPLAGWLRAAYPGGDVAAAGARLREGPRTSDSTLALLTALTPGEGAAPAAEVEARELALVIEPGDLGQRALLARARLEAGDIEGGQADLEQLREAARGEPLDRQALLRALEGAQTELAVSLALETVDDPEADAESLELAAAILHGAGHERVDDALRAVVDRHPARDGLLEHIAWLAYDWGRYDLARELAEQAGDAAGRDRLVGLRMAADLRLGEGTERVEEALTASEGGLRDDELRRLGEALLARGEERIAELALSRLARRIDRDEMGAPVLGGLAEALRVYVEAGAVEAGRAFVAARYPELALHPETLGLGAAGLQLLWE